MATQFIPPGGLPTDTPVGTDGDTLGSMIQAASKSIKEGGDISTNIVQAALATQSRKISDIAGDIVDVRNFGVKADGVKLTDASIASGASVVTSASYSFTDADVGKTVVVHSASGYGLAAFGQIVSVSNGAATLSANANASITSGTAFSERMIPLHGIP